MRSFRLTPSKSQILCFHSLACSADGWCWVKPQFLCTAAQRDLSKRLPCGTHHGGRAISTSFIKVTNVVLSLAKLHTLKPAYQRAKMGFGAFTYLWICTVVVVASSQPDEQWIQNLVFASTGGEPETFRFAVAAHFQPAVICLILPRCRRQTCRRIAV